MALPPSLKEPSKRQTIKRYTVLSLRVGLALALAAFISQVKLDYLESYLYDLRVRLRPAPSSSGNIVLIMIDPATVEKLKGPPSFIQHTEFLQKLESTRPKALLYDLKVPELKGTPQEAKKFAAATEAFAQFFVITDALEMRGEKGKLKFSPPLEKIKLFSGPKSSDRANFAKDNVTRRLLISYQDQIMVHPFLASQINPEIIDRKKIKGLFDFFDSEQTYINFRSTGAYTTFSFADVLDGQVPAEKFKDKIIILGRNLELSEEEYILTPYSRDVVAMTTAEMHANMIDTLILNNASRKSNEIWNLLFTMLISIITVHVVFSMRPARGLMIIAFTGGLYSLFSFFLFWPFGIWISMAHPLIAIFLCYYFFIPYRLIIENRRSWEYYQRNQLLKQVEELKTNFISMMSHDLKTPIARIQGMTEVMLKSATALTSLQQEAVDSIRQSSDDLLKFVNSILNYAKIESQGVQLHLQSKDINVLLAEVIRKHEFLARVKKIKVTSELEPLFPIPMDPELIRQILSNLVENAIKYSPDETEIKINSFEKNGFVVIKIKDQGLGISTEDLPHIFMKFFRSQNAKSSPIKGSGLGLYLAQYFTELHKGKIEVESVPGAGSVFTVSLPLSTNVVASS